MSNRDFAAPAGASLDSTTGESRDELFARLRDEDFGLPTKTEPLADAEPAREFEPAAIPPAAVYEARALHQPIVLLYPFALAGRQVERVQLVPPTLGDVESVMAGKISQLEMVARMAGLPIEILRAMRWPDIDAVTELAGRLAPPMDRAA